MILKTIVSVVISLSLFSICSAYEDQPTVQVGTYAASKLPVNTIPRWQLDIYKELQIPFKTVLYLHTLKVLECPNSQDGLCKSRADTGPFQINQIHKEDYKYSNYLYDNKDIETLFKFQVTWTYNRCKSMVDRFDITEDRVLRMKKLAVLHNGNTAITKSGVQFRYMYGDRSVIVYNMLQEYYKDIDPESLDY